MSTADMMQLLLVVVSVPQVLSHLSLRDFSRSQATMLHDTSTYGKGKKGSHTQNPLQISSRLLKELADALQGWSPLHSAASAGHEGIVDLLVANGANVNATNSGGRTPLHYAVSL